MKTATETVASFGKPIPAHPEPSHTKLEEAVDPIGTVTVETAVNGKVLELIEKVGPGDGICPTQLAREADYPRNTSILYDTQDHGRRKPIKGFVCCRCLLCHPMLCPNRDSSRIPTVTETVTDPPGMFVVGGGAFWGPLRLAIYSAAFLSPKELPGSS